MVEVRSSSLFWFDFLNFAYMPFSKLVAPHHNNTPLFRHSFFNP